MQDSRGTRTLATWKCSDQIVSSTPTASAFDVDPELLLLPTVDRNPSKTPRSVNFFIVNQTFLTRDAALSAKLIIQHTETPKHTPTTLSRHILFAAQGHNVNNAARGYGIC